MSTFVTRNLNKQSSNAPLLHYRIGVKSFFSFRANVWMENKPCW